MERRGLTMMTVWGMMATTTMMTCWLSSSVAGLVAMTMMTTKKDVRAYQRYFGGGKHLTDSGIETVPSIVQMRGDGQ